MLGSVGTKNYSRCARGVDDGGQDFFGEFRRIDQRSRARVIDHESVAARSQQGVEWDWNDTGFDGTPK